jgi:hypothetical protein
MKEVVVKYREAFDNGFCNHGEKVDSVNCYVYLFKKNTKIEVEVDLHVTKENGSVGAEFFEVVYPKGELNKTAIVEFLRDNLPLENLYGFVDSKEDWGEVIYDEKAYENLVKEFFELLEDGVENEIFRIFSM